MPLPLKLEEEENIWILKSTVHDSPHWKVKKRFIEWQCSSLRNNGGVKLEMKVHVGAVAKSYPTDILWENI